MKNTDLEMEFYRDEIRRAQRVLGKGKGLAQNQWDIYCWKSEGRIDDDEYNELMAFAKAINLYYK